MLTPRAKAWRGSGESIEVGGRRTFIRDRTGAGPPLPLRESLLIAWPQAVGLIAGTIVLFVATYVAFQRQEVRA